jgi:hypothetical protein
MQLDRVAGTTVLTGLVVDQAHLHGLIQQTQELGLELISIGPADEGPGVLRSAEGGADDECADG